MWKPVFLTKAGGAFLVTFIAVFGLARTTGETSRRPENFSQPDRGSSFWGLALVSIAVGFASSKVANAAIVLGIENTGTLPTILVPFASPIMFGLGAGVCALMLPDKLRKRILLRAIGLVILGTALMPWLSFEQAEPWRWAALLTVCSGAGFAAPIELHGALVERLDRPFASAGMILLATAVLAVLELFVAGLGEVLVGVDVVPEVTFSILITVAGLVLVRGWNPDNWDTPPVKTGVHL
jgi:hypothetical protein